jgi:hypothetical protein
MKITGRSALVLFFYFLSSMVVLLVFVTRPGIEGHPRARVPDVVYGTAHRPFVFRALLPTTVRAISAVTPDAVRTPIERDLHHKRLIRILGWDQDYLYEYVVALGLMALCFLGFAYALRRLVHIFYDYPDAVADLTPVLGLLCLPIFFRYFSYLYDPPNLLLFALAAIVVYERRLFGTYVVLLLAAVNKETAILIAGLFVLREYRVRSMPSLVGHAIALTVVWAAVRAGLGWVYRDNPGNWIENYFMDHNLRLPIEHPLSLLMTIAVALIFGTLVRKGWSRKPRFLRWGLVLTLVPLVSASLVIGFVDELRVYYEAVPFLYLLCVPTVVAAFGGPKEPLPVDTY